MARTEVQLTALGHAGLRLDSPSLRLVMDPWFSRKGAFQASWFQFPSNDHLDVQAVLDCDWIALSHQHLDHMDFSALAQRSPRVRVAIPKYASSQLRQRLERGGLHNVVEVAAWTCLRLNDSGDWLTFIPEESPMCEDSAMLVSAGGVSVLNVNDARPSLAQLRRAAHEAGGSLDLMAIQVASATWHPICYEYPPDVAARLSAEKRLAKFKSISRLVRLVRPGLLVPFAGPPCFLDPVLQQHNRSIAEPGIFPDPDYAAAWLRASLPGQAIQHWLPGDTYEVRSARHVPDPQFADFSYREADGYLDAYARERRAEVDAVWAAHPEPGSELAEEFADHFARLGELSSYFLHHIDMTVRFEVEGPGGGRWDVHLAPDRVRVDLHGQAEEVQYRFRLASRWLAPVIRGAIGWEDLFLSLRFSAWRHPDLYNDYFIGLLKHADPDALAAVEAYESRRSDETMVVTAAGGERYEISRYCPHAGTDFSHGMVLDGHVVRCLGHLFEFDLTTGRCLNARCDPIVSRQLVRDSVA